MNKCFIPLLYLLVCIDASAQSTDAEDLPPQPFVIQEPDPPDPRRETEYEIFYDEPPPYLRSYEPEKDGSDRDIAARVVLYNAFVADFREGGRLPFEHLKMHYPSIGTAELNSFLDDLAATLAQISEGASKRKARMVCRGRPKNDKAIYARIKSVKRKSNNLIAKAIRALEKRHNEVLMEEFWRHVDSVTDGYTTTVSVPQERNAYYGVTDYDFYTQICGDANE